jgi:hypothetical protein
MKKPAGEDALVLYLDFDGVLHHENVLWHPRKGVYMDAPGHELFEHAQLLEEVLMPYPQVRIVLSTSWVRQYGFTGTAKRLPPAVRARAIGATFHSRLRTAGIEYSFAMLPRGLQVVSDAVKRKPFDWLALDDDYRDWPVGSLDKLVRTDPQQGISAPAVLAELREKLARLGSPS